MERRYSKWLAKVKRKEEDNENRYSLLKGKAEGER